MLLYDADPIDPLYENVEQMYIHHQILCRRETNTGIFSWKDYLVWVFPGEARIYQKSDLIFSTIYSMLKPIAFSSSKYLYLQGENPHSSTSTLYVIDENGISSHYQLALTNHNKELIACYWNDLVLFGNRKSGDVMYLDEKLNFKHFDCVEQIRRLIPTKRCLWALSWADGEPLTLPAGKKVHFDGPLYPTIFKSANDMSLGIGNIRIDIEFTEMCYWKHHDVVVTTFFDGSLTIRNPDTGDELTTFPGHKNQVIRLCDWNNRLYTATRKGEVKVFTIDGFCLDIFQALPTIHSMCVYDKRMWISNENFLVCYSAKLSRKLIRNLWVGWKEPDCVWSVLPKEILLYIISYL